MYNKPGLPHTGQAGAAGGVTMLAVAHNTLAVLVLVFAAMALCTIGAELWHRHTKED